MKIEDEGGYPSPDEFPDYSDVDSRTVLDPDGSFDEEVADYEAEPTSHEDGGDG